MSINESSMWAAVHRMESASEQMARAAEEITQAVQRFAFLLEPGYGGNGLRLIELLEQAAPQPEQSAHVSVPRELLEDLVVHIEDNTCTHENTYRGGAIWEICDDCGDKWADDRGGKPAFKWPDCVEKARALLNGGEA